MVKKFLPIEKVKKLQESIKFLDNYLHPKDEMHHIGPNINTENVKQTNLLRELGYINKRKIEIIDELLSSN